MKTKNTKKADVVNVLLVKLEITSIYKNKLRVKGNYCIDNLVKSLRTDDALGAFFTADGNWFQIGEIM